MAEHLTPLQIVRLAEGSLSSLEERSQAEAHLAACRECLAAVEGARQDLSDRTLATSDPGASQTNFGVTIPGYRILGFLSRGGQGLVYRAVQLSTKREVAIKVLSEGQFTSDKDRYRFEREVDLIARLDHPHIVTVFDSGEVDGRPYYAMQFISGAPVNRYADDCRLGMETRLRLFLKICRAVNFAHQHGVIHRDLKPGNILVDTGGEPHVLDFGLAKSTGPGATVPGRTMTVTGEFLGTLAYASPEQTLGRPDRIDIRTDVYSLGLILYELLTGAFPYPIEGQIAEVLRNIADAEPRRMSAHGSRIADELELIVRKSLAKDPNRRYQTAGALADDLDRYLEGRPIDARRDSTLYVLRKMLWRHRLSVSIVSLVLVFLTAFAVIVSIQNFRIAEQRNRAEWRAYLASMRAAAGAYENADTVSLEENLDACPEQLRGWEWHYLRAGADASEWTLSTKALVGRHPSYAFSPSGTLIAASGRSGPDWEVRLWKNGRANRPVVLGADEGQVWSMAFSQDEHFLASASVSGTARIWDLRSESLLQVLEEPDASPQRFHGVGFTPDGSKLLVSTQRGEVLIWDVPSGTLLQKIPALRGETRTLAVSPAGGRVAVGCTVGCPRDAAKILEIRTGRTLITLPTSGGVAALAWSADGKTLATGGDDRVVQLWDPDTGTAIGQLTGFPDRVADLVFSPDGERIAASARTGIWIWQLEDRRLTGTLRGHRSWVSRLAFAEGGAQLLSGSRDETIRGWNLESALRPRALPGVGRVRGLQAARERNRLLSLRAARGARNLVMLDIHESTNAVQMGTMDDEVIGVASLGEDGRTVYALTGETLRVLDAGSGEIRRTLLSPEGDFGSGQICATGEFLAAARCTSAPKVTDDIPSLQFWRLPGFEPEPMRENLDPCLMSLACQTGGRLVATGSQQGNVWLVDAADGTVRELWPENRGRVNQLSFSHDGARLAAASRAGLVAMWDVRTGERLWVHAKEGSQARYVGWSWDGTRLAVTYENAEIDILDSRMADRMLTLSVEEGTPHHPVFGWEDQWLAVGSGEQIYVWDAAQP